MHDDRSGLPRGAPPPNSPEHHAQRVTLLELVAGPPPEGDRIAELAARLGLPRSTLDDAVTALVAAALAERDGEIVRATHAALYFDYLWPVKP